MMNERNPEILIRATEAYVKVIADPEVAGPEAAALVLESRRAGYSGGGCNGGPRRPGSWWPTRAVMFGQYATNWLRAPRGTRNGLFGRVSLRQLGA